MPARRQDAESDPRRSGPKIPAACASLYVDPSEDFSGRLGRQWHSGESSPCNADRFESFQQCPVRYSCGRAGLHFRAVSRAGLAIFPAEFRVSAHSRAGCNDQRSGFYVAIQNA